MIKLFATVSFALLIAASASAQKKKPTVKTPVAGLQKMLSTVGLPFRMVNDSMALIPYEGEYIDSFSVVVLSVSDLLIVFTNLTEALPGKIDPSKYAYLLQRNEHFDIIKLSMDSEKNVYVRADAYRSSVATPLLARIIKQVANVSNIISGELKQGNQ